MTSTVEQPPAAPGATGPTPPSSRSAVPGRRVLGVVVASAIVATVAGVLAAVSPGGDGADAADRRAARSTTTTPAVVRDATRGALVGSEFPTVSAIGTNGRPFAVQSGLGTPTVVVAWPTDCDCRPMLRSADDVFVNPPRPLGVVGFVFSEDIAATATEVINAGVLFPTAPDAGAEVAGAVAPGGIQQNTVPPPQVLVLDADRKVVAVFGADVTAAELRDFVARRFP